MKKKTNKMICSILAIVMILGFFPGFDISNLFAQAATNAGQAFQGQDSDIFSALGFDTS